MGDVAMTVPVLRAMRRQYPGVRIVMLTRESFGPFFDGLDIELFYGDFKRKHYGIGGIHRLYKELKEKYSFDIVIDLHNKLYSVLLRRLFAWGGTQVFTIDKGRVEKKALMRRRNKAKVQLRTMVMRYADTFARAGYPVRLEWKLERAGRAVPEMAGEKQGSWIGLAPFAKHTGKILPWFTVRELVELTARELPGATVFIFGGGDTEKAQARELENDFAPVVSVIGKLGLRQELDLISNLDVMISMDSSAMHMSSLVGVPVVSVWGATHRFAGFMGFGQQDENAAETDLFCRPCSIYGNKPCYRHNYECLTELTPGQVFEKVRAILEAQVPITI